MIHPHAALQLPLSERFDLSQGTLTEGMLILRERRRENGGEKRDYMLFMSQNRTSERFASVPEGRPGLVGLYTVSAHVDPRRLIKGVILKKED